MKEVKGKEILLDADFLQTYGITWTKEARRDPISAVRLAFSLGASSRFKKSLGYSPERWDDMMQMIASVMLKLDQILWYQPFQITADPKAVRKSEREHPIPVEPWAPETFKEAINASEKFKEEQEKKDRARSVIENSALLKEALAAPREALDEFEMIIEDEWAEDDM